MSSPAERHQCWRVRLAAVCTGCVGGPLGGGLVRCGGAAPVLASEARSGVYWTLVVSTGRWTADWCAVAERHQCWRVRLAAVCTGHWWCQLAAGRRIGVLWVFCRRCGVSTGSWGGWHTLACARCMASRRIWMILRIRGACVGIRTRGVRHPIRHVANIHEPVKQPVLEGEGDEPRRRDEGFWVMVCLVLFGVGPS